MKVEYGSFAYCLYLALALLILLALFYILRNRSPRTQKAAIFALMLVNVGQHLLKSVLYPHLYGTGFSLVNTAYNVCSLLILASPFALLGGGKVFKPFLSYAGTVASLLALAAPFWFLGQTVWQWEFLRFYVCHVLLFCTSALPLLFKLHRPRYRDFWKAGLLFLGMLGVILLNDVLFFLCDQSADPNALYAFLQEQNPLWSMHPTDVYPRIAQLFTALSPKIFLPTEAHPTYTPVLWYAVPLYLSITALAFVLYFIADGRQFAHDVRSVAKRKA